MGLSAYARCPDCGKIVKLNKPILGSAHLCITEEEAQRKAAQRRRTARRRRNR